jgi:enoyl-CoA hydratase/carnithine racemase
LPRQLPLKIAMGLILTGGRISAQDALTAGLVNEVVPLGDLIPAADRWAAQIVECAPLSVQACKQAITMGADLPLDAALARRYPIHEQVGLSLDRAEGAKAFSEKRRPVWQGR